MVKLKRFFENIENMPDNATLKQMYGPEGYPLQWQLAWKRDNVYNIKDADDVPVDNTEFNRQRQEFLNNQGAEKNKIEQNYLSKDIKLREIENIKIDVASKVTDILGNMLKNDRNEFLDELNTLITKYSEFKTTVNPNIKPIDIDAPFRESDGTIKKFKDRISEESSIIPNIFPTKSDI